MEALYPTKTRLALLRQAKAGHVIHWPEVEEPWTSLESPGETARAVTARVEEQIRAGWLKVTDEVVQHFGRRVRPTAAGEAVLAEYTQNAVEIERSLQALAAERTEG